MVGLFLWLWLNQTRMGMVIRAGVDDQAMVRALGINIGARVRGHVLRRRVPRRPRWRDGRLVRRCGHRATTAQWLLNSLIVVIVGGLGSMKGAVAGSLLYGMVLAFAPAYLPTAVPFYAIIVTFVLLAIVLAVRPYGLFGKPA